MQKNVKNILFFIQSGIVGLGIITFAIQLEIISVLIKKKAIMEKMYRKRFS